MIIKHIDWTAPEYEDRLVLRFEGSNIIERAEWHTVIRGTVYAVVRKQSHGTYFKTYRVGPDGFARECNSGMGNRPLHYKLLHEGKTVILQSCNDSGEPPRRRPCTMCRAKHEAA